MWRRDDELQTLLRESAENFSSTEHSLARFRHCRTSAEGFDLATWTAMAGLGWTGILLSEADGGSGLGLSPALTLAEVFGQSLIPEPLVASSVIAATVIAAAQTATARRLAAELAFGALVATLAFQEQPNEIVPELPRSSLEPRDGKLVLSGRKVFVPAWTGKTLLLATADFGGRPAVVAVRPDAPGVTATVRRMSDGGMTADIAFDQVRLDADALLAEGEEARAAIGLALARGRLALSAQLEGLARTLLRLTIDYVKQRVQFDQPLANFQALRHKLVDLHASIELAGASWRAAAAALESRPDDEAAMLVSAAKARCSDVALEVAKAAIQYHGAFGYTEEADVGLFVNAALRWSSWLGNAATHRQLAISHHKKRCSDHA